jgi:hypothetical protein
MDFPLSVPPGLYDAPLAIRSVEMKRQRTMMMIKFVMPKMLPSRVRIVCAQSQYVIIPQHTASTIGSSTIPTPCPKMEETCPVQVYCNPFAPLRMNFPTHGQSGVENHLMLCPISFQLPSVLMLKKKWSDMISARMRSRLSTTWEKRRDQENKRKRQRDKETKRQRGTQSLVHSVK